MFKEITRLYAPRRMLFGCGCLDSIGEEIKRLRGEKVLLVTDPGVKSAGLIDKVLDRLDEKGFSVDVFPNVQANPTTENVAEGLSLLGSGGSPVIVAVGGGSPIDAGKAIAALATNGGELRDYDGVDLLQKRMLPFVAVNTTAGTGSEVSRAAVITDTVRKWKIQVVDENVTPDVAIDDPLMTISLPQAPTAQTGMDALTHAIEGLVCINASHITEALALRAISLITKNLRIAYADGSNVDARTKVMYGQAAAGLAFTNAGVGNVHAMAHQLGAVLDMPHGLANAVILPYVMEFNLIAREEKFAAAAKEMGGDELYGLSNRALATRACSMVVALNRDIGIPRSLKECDVKEDDLDMFVEKSMADGCVTLNPRHTNKRDMEELWRRAYHGLFKDQTEEGVLRLYES